MNILFVHQNFPGQFGRLAFALATRGHRVVALAQHSNAGIPDCIEVQIYRLARGQTPEIHPLVAEFEAKVLRAEACARQAQALATSGFAPDVIIAHPGWGEALYLKDVFPRARLIAYAEFFYRAVGQDFGFDPEFSQPDLHGRARLHTKNANLCVAFDLADQGISPTHWQASTHPDWIQAKLSVIHDGIDTDAIKPNAKATMSISNRQLNLSADDEVLTFVSRNLEPVRGYHRFMRALPEILRRRPRAVAVVVGGGGVNYGSLPEQGSYRQHFLDEVKKQLDPSRVIMIDRLPHPALLTLFQLTQCHVYLTYPFVLSWSMLEAMSAGAVVVGSRTAPVEEVITDGQNGYLADFFDSNELVDKVCAALATAPEQGALRQAARQTIRERYDLQRCSLPALLSLVEQS